MITCSYFDHVKYSAQEFRNRDKDFVGNGVLKPTTDFALSFPGGMAANPAPGTSWVDGYRIGYDASPVQTLTFDVADPTNPRIDLIEIGYTGTGATGAGVIKIVKGTAAGTPIQPQPDTGFMSIFAVNVGAGATSILAGNVTDLRVSVVLSGAATTPLSTTTPTTETIGSSGNPGTGSAAAREDHEHGMPSAPDLLIAIKTVDGAGSGLDSDFFQGHSPSYFQQAIEFTPAPINSPALTGTPTVPTAPLGTNTTQAANAAFVVAAIAALVNSSPSTLDTLKELADSLGDDPNFAATIATALGLKAPLASPVFTGTPTVPTATVNTNTTQSASTGFVLGQLSSTAPTAETVGALGNVGTGTTFARSDHTHAMPSDTDILTAVKVVDGVGSGLDADLLNGNQATAFATSAQGTLATNALPIAGGTMTGILKAQNNTSYTVAQAHNMILSTGTAVLASMGNGDIWIQYA